MRVYLAGPLGFSEAGRSFHDGVLVPLLTGLGHEVLDPWKLTPQSKIDAVLSMSYGPRKRKAWQSLNPEIAARNQQAIDESECILAVLDGTDVDSGTAAEIGYAYARAKPIIGYRGDFRLSADNEGSTVNLQVEYFILKSGGEIVATINEIPAALSRILSSR
jgi:nucleoside 2-deoxyribosyltransferase